MSDFLAQMRNDEVDDLDLAGSDDEIGDSYENDNFMESPIKDDYFEGKVEEDEDEEEIHPIQSEEEEPDFTKMNNFSVKNPKKDIDLRKGITIQKRQNVDPKASKNFDII